MGHVIGLDIGAHSAWVAGADPAGRPVTLTDRHRDRLSPTVALDGSWCRVGGSPPQGVGPVSVARSVPCTYGDPGWRLDGPVGPPMRAAEVGSLVVRQLRTDAERILGGPVTGAVLTVPAGYGDVARRTAEQACQIAGLAVHRTLLQPTAVALAYARSRRHDTLALVYSLGGGSFDAAVVRIAPDRVDVLAARGDPALGGLDWDHVVMRLLNERFRAEGGADLLADDTWAQELQATAEAVKRRLSAADRAVARLSRSGRSRLVALSRSEFIEATAPLLRRTEDITESVLRSAGVSWDRLDLVLPAGGGTRIPGVRALLQGAWGRRIEPGVDVEQAAVLGAADYAARGADLPRTGARGPLGTALRVGEVASYGLGTLARDAASGVLRNLVVLGANTALPASRRRLLGTVEDGQRFVHLEVTQGDDPDPAAVQRIGWASFRLPPLAAGAPLEIDYAYDLHQVAHLTVTHPPTGRILHRDVVRNAAVMSRHAVTESTRRMRRLRLV